MSRTAIVVGGGVIGSAAAWRLAVRGLGVTLLEQFEPGHTHGSSYGSSRIFRLAYPDTFYTSLAVSALALWRDLEQEAGTGVLTLTGGVDHGPEHSLRPLRDSLTAVGQAAELLDPAEAAARWPGLRFDNSVLYHANAGRLHADDAVAALQLAARKRGAAVRTGTRVENLRVDGDEKPAVVTTDGDELTADLVVVAPGGWAPKLLGAVLADLPPLRVTQEQPAHFQPLNPADPWPSFIHHPGAGLADGGVYGLGSADGVKVGFGAQGPVIDPDHRDRSIDPHRAAALQAYAEQWLPGVDARSQAPLTCLYTLTPDHDFVVDRRGPLTVLAGFSGHGFKFAPAIGELAVKLAVDREPAPGRFALGPRTPRA